MREFIFREVETLIPVKGKKLVPYGELVRCKDCKFGEACKNGAGEHGVMCYNSQSASHLWAHEPDWFCADGEKEGGKET